MTSDTAAGASPPTPEPRQRLLDAMAVVLVEKGYSALTVADVVRAARMSRRTFYEHFSSRDDCYQAMLADFTAKQIAWIRRSVDPSATWREQARQAIEAWFSGAKTQPEITLSWIRDSPALPAARAAQVEARHSIIDMIWALTSESSTVASTNRRIRNF